MNKKQKWILAAVFTAASIANTVYQTGLQKPIKEKRRGDKPCVLCIGDSITFGDGVRHKRENCWVRVLENLFGGSMQILNYGICGATLQAEGDHPYDPRFWSAAREQRPDAVILMLGTNDSKPQNWNAERYERQLREKLRDLENWENVRRIILMLPPWCCGRKPGKKVMYKISNEVIRDEIRPILRSVAEEKGLQVIDLYALTEGHREYFGDGVHPNTLGNRVIAEHIHSELKMK